MKVKYFMMIKSLIKKVAVRIEAKVIDGNNEILGSGILWRPHDESEYDYAFTAAHVVEELNEAVCVIRYLDESGKEESIEVENINICKHPGFLKKSDNSCQKDVAVIRFNKLSSDIIRYYFEDADFIPSGDKLIFRGFPECINDNDSFKLSAKTDEGSFGENDKDIHKFTYSVSNTANLNITDRNSELKGFSGMGLFQEKGNSMSLIGLHSYGLKNDAPFNEIVGMPINLIIEVCKNKSWDVPKIESDIDGMLIDCIGFFDDEIKNQSLQKIMTHDVVLKNYTKTIKSGNCGCSKECTRGVTEHKCEWFRGNLLILLSILKYMGSNVDASELLIRYNSEGYPVKYICSEGTGAIARVKIQDFIESLKTDYLCKNKIKDNTLIIWASEKAIKGELIIHKNEFQNILPDITLSILSNPMADFDIKNGFLSMKSLSVIHISAIIDCISEFNIDQEPTEIKEMIYKLFK